MLSKKISHKKCIEALGLYKCFNYYVPSEIPQALFDEFYISGRRVGYEQEYFKKRGLLTASAVMYMLDGKDEYKTRLNDTINSILSEKTWALPAHVGRTEKHPERVIDLFSAETAQSLCEICALMPGAIDDNLHDRIRNEVFCRIILPFEEKSFGWEKAKNNWSAVCGGCVGMVYLYEFPERFENVRKRLFGTMESYLSGFGDDGICTEGLLYWNYGFGYYLFFADLLKRRNIGDIIHNSKVNAIARFQQNMFMRKNYTVSFSDSDISLGYNSGITHFLKRTFSDVEIPLGAKRCDIDNCYRFAPYVRSFLWAEEDYEPAMLKGEQYFPDAQWYINRQNNFTFAAKCGNNDEPHNHNDVGNFIIADDNGQVIADFGAGEYSADYFNEKTRYESFAASSRGHNVPVIDGLMQKAGREFCGSVLKHTNNEFVLDIGGAYGDNIRFERAFTVTENAVRLCDICVGRSFTERFVTFIKPTQNDGRICIGDWSVEGKCVIKENMVNDHEGKPCSVYILDFEAKDKFIISFNKAVR